MHTLVIVLHILACLALILIVLLQTGRGAEMGAAFGGASQTLFGGTGGTTFLSKLTTAAAIVFMMTCLGLTYLSAGPQTKSIMQDVPVEKPQGPALPEAKPVQPLPAQPGPSEATPRPQESSGVAPEKAAPQPQEAAKVEEKSAPASKPEEKQQEKTPGSAPKK